MKIKLRKEVSQIANKIERELSKAEGHINTEIERRIELELINEELTDKIKRIKEYNNKLEKRNFLFIATIRKAMNKKLSIEIIEEKLLNYLTRK
jgi:hypothetical protein